MNALESRVIGRRMRRTEDPALLQGKGRFIDDIKIPGMLHAAFVRSPHAHALISSIDVGAALGKPGVAAVYVAADLLRVLKGLRLPLHFPAGVLPDNAMPLVLAPREVCYVGETVALIVASSRYLAEDAADEVFVDYEVLPAVVDPRAAMGADSPKASLDTESNLFKRFRVGFGDCDQAFATAPHVFRETLFQHRGAAHPMEGRGVIATVDPGADTMTVWSSTQMAHEVRANIAEMLGFEEERVRVIAPDVGGGFGAKFLVYPEEIAIAAAARLLGRPVKWIEDRREHFISAIHERDQYWELEVAVDGAGVLRGVRGLLTHDQGAFAPHSITVPYNSASSVLGPYIVPAFGIDVIVARTNKVPVIPVRGAGYPQGTFAMERLLDRVAAELGLDRAEVRSRNLIPAERMPYSVGLINRAGAPVVYDSGDYASCQRRCLEAAGYAEFPARQAAARREGRLIGIGIAHGVKCTGRGPFESGTVRVSTSGKVSVYTGALAMGQGLKTTLAQICAEQLGIDPADIDVTCGDTAYVSLGIGGYGSRQTMIAGSSVHLAAAAVRAKALKVAALMLAPETDFVLAGGKVEVAGRPEISLPFARIAVALHGAAGYNFPEGVEAGLEATFHFTVNDMAYANAFHVCEVEVDAETGHVQVIRYVALHDSGKLISPQIAEGQVHGSVVHGIGNALFEWMGYDDAGQPITTTYGDYLLPTATEVPNIEVLTHETLSPLNPLGMKGVGEVGVIPVAAAIASAVESALQPLAIRIREMPLTPVRLLELVLQAQSGSTSAKGGHA